ncbi:MAG: hypothetical protein R3305_00420 [Gammaproteobacteria bacterium]|nr:hypothetical protein [Gammaproteobacteria bacterium]
MLFALVGSAVYVLWPDARRDAAAPAELRDALDVPLSLAGPGGADPVAVDSIAPPSGANSDSEPSAPAAAVDAYRFTVAIEPPDLPSDDARSNRPFELIYASFVEGLHEISHLDLIELEADAIEAELDDVDFVLRAAGERRFDQDLVWNFRVTWVAMRGGRGTVSETQLASEPLVIGDSAAAALRRYPFPPGETRTVELAAQALDTSLPQSERFAALDELQDTPKRFEFVGIDAMRSVAVAAVQVVANSSDPEIRSRAWRAMDIANVDDPYLAGPLVDSLLHDVSDAVRFEAVKLLTSGYGDDPRAVAALDYARTSDPSPRVATHVKWHLFDAVERTGYVEATLLNDKLDHQQRIELLVAEVRGLEPYVERGAAVARLGAATRAQAAQRGDPAVIVPPLLKLLEESESDGTRLAAASILVHYADDDGVRAALERSVRSDTSYELRFHIERAIARIHGRFGFR